MAQVQEKTLVSCLSTEEQALTSYLATEEQAQMQEQTLTPWLATEEQAKMPSLNTRKQTLTSCLATVSDVFEQHNQNQMQCLATQDKLAFVDLLPSGY